MKKIFLLFILILTLVSCNNQSQTKYLFIDNLSYEGLEKPKREISSVDDMIYALDYMAFYRVSDKVSFKFTDDYKKSVFNPQQVINQAYDNADLADVYAIHLDDSNYKNDGVFTLYYSMSKDIATSKPTKEYDYKFIHNFDYKLNEGSSYELDINNRKEVECENSEQLYYLAMNGYNPKPKVGSMAEVIYNLAKEVLYKITTKDMDDFNKIKNIYDYLTNEIYYDFDTAYTTETYLVKEQAYYLEGVFLNKCAVCDGKAKAYALLLNMVGIDCYRVTGYNELGYDHAWNIVKYNNKYYTSCTTYGEPSPIDFKIDGENKFIVSNYNMLLQNRKTPFADEWEYVINKHRNIIDKIEDDAFDVYEKMSNNELNYKCNNLDDVKKLVNYVKEKYDINYKKIEFNYIGNDENFKNDLISYVKSLGNANALNPKYNIGDLYQIIFMGE